MHFPINRRSTFSFRMYLLCVICTLPQMNVKLLLLSFHPRQRDAFAVTACSKKRNGLGQCCVVKMQWQKRCHSIDVNCQTVLISVNRSKYRYDHMEALFVLIAHPMATAYEMLDQRSASVLLWLCSNVHDTCWEKCVGFGLCFKSNALSWVYGLLVIVCLKAEVSEYHLAKWWWGV